MTATAGRPRLGFGLFTLAMVAAFIGLGVWQLQRRVEKHALIEALTERLAATPVPLPPAAAWSSLNAEKDEFRRVHFRATFGAGSDVMVYSSGSAVRDDVSGVAKGKPYWRYRGRNKLRAAIHGKRRWRQRFHNV